MWKWITTVVGSIISGLVVYYLTQGPKIILPPNGGTGPVPPLPSPEKTEKGYYCFIAETSEECPTYSRDIFSECNCGDPSQTGIVIRYK